MEDAEENMTSPHLEKLSRRNDNFNQLVRNHSKSIRHQNSEVVSENKVTSSTDHLQSVVR